MREKLQSAYFLWLHLSQRRPLQQSCADVALLISGEVGAYASWTTRGTATGRRSYRDRHRAGKRPEHQAALAPRAWTRCRCGGASTSNACGVQVLRRPQQRARCISRVPRAFGRHYLVKQVCGAALPSACVAVPHRRQEGMPAGRRMSGDLERCSHRGRERSAKVLGL